MAKQNTPLEIGIEEVIQVFNLTEGSSLWLRKSKYSREIKSKEDWEKVLKENLVI